MNEQGIAMLRWVKTGKQSGESTEILSGLRKGERIVINADEIPGSGVEVVIKQQNGANL